MAWSKPTSLTAALSLLLRQQRCRPFSSRPLLASETSTAGGGSPSSDASTTTANVLLVHGLLGSGRNWRSAARALAAGAAARAAELVQASSASSSSSSASSLPAPPPPRVTVTAVDLRCHGGTNAAATTREHFAPPHDISAAAADVNAFATAAFGEESERENNGVDLSSPSPSSSSPSPCSSSPPPPPAAPDVLIGHSLGGKVALEAARQALVAAAPLPEQLWVLDSPLSARRHDASGPATRRRAAATGSRGPPRAPGATAGVLAAVRSVPPSALGSRREAERWLLENSGGRVTPAVAAWLCSQLVAVNPPPPSLTTSAGGGVRGGGNNNNTGRGAPSPPPPPLLSFAFDPSGAADLFESYQTLDAWPLLRCPPVGLGINVVVGGRSDRWSAAERRRLEEAEKGSAASAAPVAQGDDEEGSLSPPSLRRGSLKVHVLPKAGHWVHVDDQEGLLGLLVPAVAEVAAAKALRAWAAAESRSR